MATVDLSSIASYAAQIDALNKQIAVTADPTVKSLLQSQVAVLTAQMQAAATHAQAQIDSNNSFLDNMQLWTVLNSGLGSIAGGIPAIIGLFKK